MPQLTGACAAFGMNIANVSPIKDNCIAVHNNKSQKLKFMMLKFLSIGFGSFMCAFDSTYGFLATLLLAAGKRGCRWGRLVSIVLVGFCFSSQAQWMTQSIVVKPGWTAVYLHVDASSQSLDRLVGGDPDNPISEIWQWKSSVGSAQYITSPQSPLNGGSQWLVWVRHSNATSSSLGALSPNAAYLVHSTATADYTWSIKGKPAPPSYMWDISGLNLIGFSTPANNPPRFQDYLAPAQSLAGITELYQYPDGSKDPKLVLSQYATRVANGQAFWVRAANVNNTYFGPFQVILPNTTGIDFGDSSSQFSLYLRNATVNSLTVTGKLLRSGSDPLSGQTPSLPPLLARQALNATNLTYACDALTSDGDSLHWDLAPAGQPGSTRAVVIGVNRYALTDKPGALYAGILQFTDSLGFSEVNVPVSAQSASTAGLWVGGANVTQVGNYLTSYQTDANSNPVVSSNGSYAVTGIDTNMGSVPSSFPLRLIIHNDGTHSVLLQRVYYGLRQDTNVVVATTESVLDTAHLDTARRITANHLPWSADNVPWPLDGQLALGGVLSADLTTGYDDQAVNPFLHTYHPDHDNLDAAFKTQLVQGMESYSIRRAITLAHSPPGSDFTSLTTAGSTLSGRYSEVITLGGLGGATRVFNVSGLFTISRISPIATLTTR